MLILFIFANANAPTNKISYPKWKYILSNIDSYASNDVELNDSAILIELMANDCILPSVAIAQFKAESKADYSSNISKENHNIAGIKYVHQKLSIGEKNGHAVYASYRDCIKDYIRIQNLYLKIAEKRYSENKGYIDLLHSIK